MKPNKFFFPHSYIWWISFFLLSERPFCFRNNIQIWLERRVFDLFLCLKMHMKAEVTYFKNLKKQLGYKRLQLCSWKKYFSKIWKGAQQGYFCRNFKLAQRDRFLMFLYAWKCAKKLRCSILIISKIIGAQALTNVFLKKNNFQKKQFSKKHFEKYFFSRAHLQALKPHCFYDMIKI